MRIWASGVDVVPSTTTAEVQCVRTFHRQRSGVRGKALPIRAHGAWIPRSPWGKCDGPRPGHQRGEYRDTLCDELVIARPGPGPRLGLIDRGAGSPTPSSTSSATCRGHPRRRRRARRQRSTWVTAYAHPLRADRPSRLRDRPDRRGHGPTIRTHVNSPDQAGCNASPPDCGFTARDMPAAPDDFPALPMIDVSPSGEPCRRWYPRSTRSA